MASGDEDIRTGEHGVIGGFGRGLLWVLLLAVAVRAVFIFGVHRGFPLTADAWVYHHEARFVANGRGFVDPIAWSYEAAVKQAADHPPLYIVFLAIGYLVGFRSHISQLALNGIIGVVTVALVALLARRLVGDRGGLIAGVIAALYPGMWAWNGQALSESLSVLLLTAVISVAYRYLEDRSIRRAALLGGLIGLAALTRSELAMLAVLIPTLMAAHYRAGRGLPQLVKHGAVATAALLIVLAPWTAFNLARFERPVLLGTGLGRALASGSCQDTISGSQTGFWSINCLGEPMGVSRAETATLDQSEMDELWRRHALRVMQRNLRYMPVLMTARVGRMFQFWNPLEQVRHDQVTETREWWVAGAAFASFYLLAAGSVVGGVVLRRRRVRLWILVLPVGIAAIGAMTAFGTSRYRAPAEPCFVVLTAVGVDAAVRRYERRRVVAPATARAHDTRDLAHAGVGAPARPGGYAGDDDHRFAPSAPGQSAYRVGAPVGRGPDDEGAWADDLRQQALWTGRSSGADVPPDDDEPYWDEQHGAWTDGQGNYTDGYRTWSLPPVDHGRGSPRGRGEDGAADGFAGNGAPAGIERSSAAAGGATRPVRLPLVIGAVVAVLLTVCAAGTWITDASGNRTPFAPGKMPPAPALPPRS